MAPELGAAAGDAPQAEGRSGRGRGWRVGGGRWVWGVGVGVGCGCGVWVWGVGVGCGVVEGAGGGVGVTLCRVNRGVIIVMRSNTCCKKPGQVSTSCPAGRSLLPDAFGVSSACGRLPAEAGASGEVTPSYPQQVQMSPNSFFTGISF